MLGPGLLSGIKEHWIQGLPAGDGLDDVPAGDSVSASRGVQASIEIARGLHCLLGAYLLLLTVGAQVLFPSFGPTGALAEYCSAQSAA